MAPSLTSSPFAVPSLKILAPSYHAQPYDDIVELRGRMLQVSPTFVSYDVVESTSPEVILAGLKQVASSTEGAKISGAPIRKPISGFYQTYPISRVSVTMAQSVKAFVNGEECQDTGKAAESSFAQMCGFSFWFL